MSIEIDQNSGIPIWLQLRNRLIYLIRSGRFQEGDRLPTIHQMAVDLGINFNTVSKVYSDLENDGYLASYRGKGTFVLSSCSSLPDMTQADALAIEFVRQCNELGVTNQEIPALIERAIDPARTARRKVRVITKGGKDGAKKDSRSA